MRTAIRIGLGLATDQLEDLCVTETLNILHVLRAPVGGLFRHVADLSRAQTAAGHRVGIVCCSEAGDSLTEARLHELSPALALGIERIAMAREIDWRDLTATRAVHRHARAFGADVLHGHGAKGGAYARIAAARLKHQGHDVTAVYTPHGGSLHYAPKSLKGRLFMALERRLAPHTDGIVFESVYSSRVYAAQVAPRHALTSRVIPNGIGPDELEPVAASAEAADFVYVGELRHLKGVDLLLEALAGLSRPTPPTVVVVGDGPDAEKFRNQSNALGLATRVRFPGAMPARRAFALGRSLVMPSRAESFPYIVLEAAAAAVPLIATSVGGIPEIVAGTNIELVRPDDGTALRAVMQRHLDQPEQAAADARALQRIVAERYTITTMATAIEEFYRELRAA